MPGDFRINKVALHDYLNQLASVIEERGLGTRGDVLLSQALSLPGVVGEPASATERLQEDWPLIEKVLSDQRMQQRKPKPEQLMMLKRIRGVLGAGPEEERSAEAKIRKASEPASAAAEVVRRSRGN